MATLEAMALGDALGNKKVDLVAAGVMCFAPTNWTNWVIFAVLFTVFYLSYPDFLFVPFLPLSGENSTDDGVLQKIGMSLVWTLPFYFVLAYMVNYYTLRKGSQRLKSL